jgi:hypothetical protein
LSNSQRSSAFARLRQSDEGPHRPRRLPGGWRRRLGFFDLDPENFRLPKDVEVDDPDELLRYFHKNHELEEIAWSIAEEVYWPEEPVLTITSPADESHRIVVEGNRRLAALKLLAGAEARSAVVADELEHALIEPGPVA